MKTLLVNATMHPVSLIRAPLRRRPWHRVRRWIRGYEGEVFATVVSSGSFARVLEVPGLNTVLDATAGSVPITEIAYSGEVVDLPDPRDGVAVIVSRVTAAAVGREDLYFPMDEVRDRRGRIVGVRGLGRFQRSAESS